MRLLGWQTKKGHEITAPVFLEGILEFLGAELLEVMAGRNKGGSTADSGMR